MTHLQIRIHKIFLCYYADTLRKWVIIKYLHQQEMVLAESEQIYAVETQICSLYGKFYAVTAKKNAVTVTELIIAIL